ncbi:MAG: murein L,D-transpeptidase catalytic domain-containing protein [Longimicrobiales bacterium]
MMRPHTFLCFGLAALLTASVTPRPTHALDRADERAREALEVLSPTVTHSSDPGALAMAFTAYYRYRDAHPSAVRNPYLFFVDFGLNNGEPRGYVFDMDALTLVDGPFTVAHGSGSGPRLGTPSHFSNRSGSHATSLGLYLTQETYTFRGRSGGRTHTSVGLRLQGVSGRFNSAARRRGVVAHGAPYVTHSKAGRSHGCPAIEMARARRLLPMIANGGMVFHYSPRDRDWLANAPWARSDDLAGAPD